MEDKKEIIGFLCKDCKKRLVIGTCGEHREETGHKDFQEIFQEDTEK